MEMEKLLYEVVVGAFGIWYNASLVNDEANQRGLATNIRKHKGKYCVACGPFDNEDDAREKLNLAKKTGYVFAYIIHL